MRYEVVKTMADGSRRKIVTVRFKEEADYIVLCLKDRGVLAEVKGVRHL